MIKSQSIKVYITQIHVFPKIGGSSPMIEDLLLHGRVLRDASDLRSVLHVPQCDVHCALALLYTCLDGVTG